MKKNLRILGALVLVGLITWRLDWTSFAQAFSKLDLRLWGLASAVYVVAQVVSSTRWRRLAGALGFRGSTLRYLAYYFIGMFCNLALPTSVGGDVVRSWYLGNQEGEPTTARRFEAFLTVFAERISGVLVLVLLCCVAAPFCPLPLPWWVWLSVAVVGLGALAGVVLMLWLPAPAGEAKGLFARLAAVVALYRRRPRLLVETSALSLVVQVLSVVMAALIGAALGLKVPALYYAVCVPLVTLLTLLPISIGGVGLREFGFILFLKPLKIPATDAVVLGVLLFAAVALPAAAGGLVMVFGRFPRLDAKKSGSCMEVRGDDDSVGGDPAQGRVRQRSATA